MDETLRAVTHELKCIECKYVLRGLPVTAACPECGTLVMNTLVETLDMPSQALAHPVHAKRIARGILTVGAGILLWTVGTTAPAAGRELVNLVSGRPPEEALADQLGSVLALIGVVLLSIGSVQLSRRDDAILLAETRNAGRWLMAGVGIWFLGAAGATVAIVIPAAEFVRISPDGLSFACLAVQLLGSAVAAVGLRTFVTVLGRRCRRFRHAGPARQSIETMVIAGAIALVAALGATMLGRTGSHNLALVSRVIEFVSGGLLLMGAMYLVVNFGWIRRILNSPPPSLESIMRVIGPNSPGESPN
ncbi:MAG: hypothetical protein EXS17_05980 [Phycisphaerales bacterium]|nr:hypothetical protein [Phycisphaerales bacterium]